MGTGKVRDGEKALKQRRRTVRTELRRQCLRNLISAECHNVNPIRSRCRSTLASNSATRAAIWGFEVS